MLRMALKSKKKKKLVDGARQVLPQMWVGLTQSVEENKRLALV